MAFFLRLSLSIILALSVLSHFCFKVDIDVFQRHRYTSQMIQIGRMKQSRGGIFTVPQAMLLRLSRAVKRRFRESYRSHSSLPTGTTNIFLICFYSVKVKTAATYNIVYPSSQPVEGMGMAQPMARLITDWS